MEQVVYEGARTPPQGKISFEEFLEWLDEDTHAEWVDGEVILKMPVSVRHYEAAGVQEYWLIDPDRQYAEFLQLDW